MQLPSLLFGVVLHVLNSFVPLTSLSKVESIPEESFHPLYHLTMPSARRHGYVPQQIRHAYGVDLSTSQGSGRSIAIIDAYHDSHLTSDMQRFIATFSLTPMYGLPGKPRCTISAGPHPCFQVINQSSTADAGWATETALDTQWAHAIAGQADILVVEAKDASAKSFAAALTLAVSKQPTVMSLSWGGAEFAKEVDWDPTFSRSMVVAASGDRGTGASFPSSSPNVLSVGGTSLQLDSDGNRLTEEVGWTGSGGGASRFENRPLWQTKNLLGLPFTLRLTPDVAFNADPQTGYAVVDNGHWIVAGGTSAAAPQWAAILTLGKNVADNAALYRLGTGSDRSVYFKDITHGSNGTCRTFCQTRPGYNAVTGLGTPIVNRITRSL